MVTLLLNRRECGCINSFIGTMITTTHYRQFIEGNISVQEQELLQIFYNKLIDSLDKTLIIAAQRIWEFKTVEELNTWRLTITDSIDVSKQDVKFMLKVYDCLREGLKKINKEEGKRMLLWYHKDIEIITGHPYSEIVECFGKLWIVKRMVDENNIPSEPIVFDELKLA